MKPSQCLLPLDSLRGLIIGNFVVRGGLLITLQFLVVNRAWEPSPSGWGYVGVLFALGGTMILGSLTLWLNDEISPMDFDLYDAFTFGELRHANPDKWSVKKISPR